MSLPDHLMSIDDYVRHWAGERPDHTVFEEAGERLTFSGLERLSRQMAAAFAECGVAKGDRIAWYGKNAALYFQLLFAAGRIGVVMVPVGWRLAPAEVAFILTDTGAKLVFAGDEALKHAPYFAPRRRLDETQAARKPRLVWSPAA